PPEVCEELAKLQNRVTPQPAEAMREALEAELGGDPSEVFAEFDWEPPGADALVAPDLAALSLLADFAQRRTAFGQNIHSGELLDEFAKGLSAELDFRLEAGAMEEMGILLGPDSRVPGSPRPPRAPPPPAPGPGAVRGLHHRRHRRAPGGHDRPGGAGPCAPALHAGAGPGGGGGWRRAPPRARRGASLTQA